MRRLQWIVLTISIVSAIVVLPSWYSATQYNIALLYSKNKGFFNNEIKSLSWLKKSANNDNAYAEYELGIKYFLGEGTKKDNSKAVYWISKASENGLPKAQLLLASFYHVGYSVKVDKTTSQYRLIKVNELASLDDDKSSFNKLIANIRVKHERGEDTSYILSPFFQVNLTGLMLGTVAYQKVKSLF